MGRWRMYYGETTAPPAGAQYVCGQYVCGQYVTVTLAGQARRGHWGLVYIWAERSKGAKSNGWSGRHMDCREKAARTEVHS